MDNLSAITPQATMSEVETFTIGLWGTRGSGKTTYVVMLLKTLSSQYKDWTFEGADPASIEWFRAASERMGSGNVFVDKTPKAAEYSFHLSQFVDGQWVRRFTLTLFDQAGELYEKSPLITYEGEEERPSVKQETGAAPSTPETYAEAFKRLMKSNAILIMLDPGWYTIPSNTPKLYSTLLSDLLSNIQRDISNVDGHPMKVPVLALCLSKIDGGRLVDAYGNDSGVVMWEGKEKQPRPNFPPLREGIARPRSVDPTRHECFLAHETAKPSTSASSGFDRSEYGVCSDQCMVFHLLSENFFEHEIRNFTRLGWKIGCFALSSIGKIEETDAHQQKKYKMRILRDGDWRREHTPPPHLPEVWRANGADSLTIDDPDEDTLPDRFYQKHLAKVPDAFRPYGLFDPIWWAYEQVKSLVSATAP